MTYLDKMMAYQIAGELQRRGYVVKVEFQSPKKYAVVVTALIK